MSLFPRRSAASRSLEAVGLDAEPPAIRRTADGGIDYDWYLLRARNTRAVSIARLTGNAFEALGAAVKRWRRAFDEHRRRRRAIEELWAMDDLGLHDLGLNRTGIYYAVDHGRAEPPAPANVNAKDRRNTSAA
ncbi:MAG: hypothetical protein KIT16_06330 [Rhodospirillaceae bacterium]|nr:hypothetical protein [Rhodospirillaceae bacterium]